MIKLPIHVVIDGSDGLGKTSVCQMLGRIMSLPVIKMSNMREYIKKGSAEEFSKLFNETLVQFEEYDFILDRGFTSSLVYDKVFDRKSDLIYLTRIENALQPKIFILTGLVPDGTYNYFRGDEVFDNTQVLAIDREFVKLAQERGYEVIPVWGKSPMQIAKYIYHKINEE